MKGRTADLPAFAEMRQPRAVPIEKSVERVRKEW